MPSGSGFIRQRIYQTANNTGPGARQEKGEKVMNQVIQERIAALRKVMEREGVDYYMAPTADFHNSAVGAM